jgi:hypothetical protein
MRDIFKNIEVKAVAGNVADIARYRGYFKGQKVYRTLICTSATWQRLPNGKKRIRDMCENVADFGYRTRYYIFL